MFLIKKKWCKKGRVLYFLFIIKDFREKKKV